MHLSRLTAGFFLFYFYLDNLRMSVFKSSDALPVRCSDSANCVADPRGSIAMGVIALCVYFPPLALPVGALAAGAAISATRKHLAG